jgi:L-ribulose-5-phosphate 3-epimerase
MRLGYSTNSIGDVDPLSAVPFLAGLGYRSLAVTLDRQVLDPFGESLASDIARWRIALDAADMARVIETGARHLLDPLRRHEPTLVSAAGKDRCRRQDFLVRALDVARALDAGCVSLWSGAVADAAGEDAIWRRLVDGLGPVLERSAQLAMPLGFEPEPGMFIDTLARFDELVDRLGRPEHMRLTVDLGHLECMGERPSAELLVRHGPRLVNVHVDDMLACRHEHLPLGEGEVDFPPLLAALAAVGYQGGVHVELPRQAHRWVATSRAAIERLLAWQSEGAVGG